jgi:L-rhamnose mutarotase
VGCARLSFLDAYSGYNQIKLKKEDEEKTAFITPYSIFCYQVTPFGLKNAGATYQRMQNCLESQIGRNIQVYIDDVVITTRKEESLINDLKETFDNLDRYKLMLNPTKCSFGVSAWQLLGFLVSIRGIEANPKKIQAILYLIFYP